MKKIIGTTLIFGLSALALVSCKTESDNDLNRELKYTMPEYNSSYSPIIEDKLPQIRITHEADTLYTDKDAKYWVTSPVSYAVKEQKKGWLSPSDPELSLPDPYYQDCTISVKNGSGIETLDDVSAEVKVRGNWTTDYEKKPLRIKFSEKQSMLGLNGDTKSKSWVLLNSYKDWSMLRDCTGLYLSKLLSDDYASDFRLVDVYINNEYWGVYVLAEQQQIAENRVNINSVKKNYTNTDIGYLLELDGYSKYEDELNQFYIPYNSLCDINGKQVKNLNGGYTIKSDIYDKSQTDFIKSYMENVWTICYSAATNSGLYEFNSDYTGLVASTVDNPYECVSKVIDIESLVNTYILQEAIVDPDIYFSSFYMDVDMSSTGDKRLKFEAPWDFDSTLGNKYNTFTKHWDYSQNKIQKDVEFKKYAALAITDVNGNENYGNPWMLVFANCDWFKDLVSSKWTQVSNSDTLNKLTNYIDTCTTKYSSSLALNESRWSSAKTNTGVLQELSAEAKACKNQREAASYLKSWLIARFNTLDKCYKVNTNN